MDSELAQLRQALNFPDFQKLKSETEYETRMRKSGKSRTWHKIQELIELLPVSFNHVLYLTSQPNGLIYLKDSHPGFDWFLIEEWAYGRKPSWLAKKFPKRCLTGHVTTAEDIHWNNGKIWEDNEMVDFFADILKSKSWQPDLIICDMNVISNEEQEQEQAQITVKKAEIDLCLKTLRMSGTLVIKLLGVSLPETRQLMTEISSCFLDSNLIKLQGSNPMNSELYLICKGLNTRMINTTPAEYQKITAMCQRQTKKQISEIKTFLLKKVTVTTIC